MAAERAWKLTRSAFEFFTPEGRFNDRQQAQAVVAAALPHLSGPAWAKTRRLLLRRESFTFLDQAQRRLAELGLDPDVLSALLDLEGLQRQAWRLSESTPGSAATRAWALARTVQLAKAEPHWQDLAGRVREVLRGVWRASSLVECINSVAQDASRAAPQDDAGFAGLEAAVLELTPVPGRAPKESDAVRPVGPEVARVELLGVPQDDSGRIAQTTVRYR